MNPFHQLLGRADSATPPVGTWLMSASHLVAEAMGCAGYDWGVLDMEHTPIGLTQAWKNTTEKQDVIYLGLTQATK